MNLASRCIGQLLRSRISLFASSPSCNFHLLSHDTCPYRIFPTLSPKEVTAILRMHDELVDVKSGAVKAFACNQLPANKPCEDRHSEATSPLTSGWFFGVFDGHGGFACSNTVKDRIFDYIALNMLYHYRPSALDDAFDKLQSEEDFVVCPHFPTKREPPSKETLALYRSSLLKYGEELTHQPPADGTPNIEDIFKGAFLRLDQDISKEALLSASSSHRGIEEPVARERLEAVISGSCSLVAYVTGRDLFVSSCGDAEAVLGSQDEDGVWHATPLSHKHDSFNEKEGERLKKAHPETEHHSIVRGGRLLGSLVPLRAFGDVQFKWTAEQIRENLNKTYNRNFLLPNYYTPPYLTAEPQIIRQRLTHRDKFLIIATDGLWDILSHNKAVTLVGKHMEGVHALDPFKLPSDHRLTLKEVNSILEKRKAAMSTPIIDTNPATYLIRHALGGTEQGIDHHKLSALLTIPHARVHRDDITISVIRFDSDYLISRSREN